MGGENSGVDGRGVRGSMFVRVEVRGSAQSGFEGLYGRGTVGDDRLLHVLVVG